MRRIANNVVLIIHQIDHNRILVLIPASTLSPKPEALKMGNLNHPGPRTDGLHKHQGLITRTRIQGIAAAAFCVAGVPV